MTWGCSRRQRTISPCDLDRPGKSGYANEKIRWEVADVDTSVTIEPAYGALDEIRDLFAAYTAMLRDIDNQLERLDRMEMTMAAPPGPDLTGMPRGSGTPSDRTGMMVERKMELEEQIDRLKAEEKQERNAIEGLILQLSDPDERAVIRLRYFDRADWESTCGVLFGDRRDYVDRVDAYQNRTYKIHGRALLNLAAVLDELEPLPELRQ